jgi:hypothetical protein
VTRALGGWCVDVVMVKIQRDENAWGLRVCLCVWGGKGCWEDKIEGQRRAGGCGSIGWVPPPKKEMTEWVAVFFS